MLNGIDKRLEKKVKAAARRFDRVLPGWFTRINLDNLDMFDTSRCIIGQAFRLGPHDGLYEGIRFTLFKNKRYNDYNGAFALAKGAWTVEVQKRLRDPDKYAPHLG